MFWEYLVLRVEKGKIVLWTGSEKIKTVLDVMVGIDVNITLDFLGGYKWELVSVAGDPVGLQYFYFKRPIK